MDAETSNRDAATAPTACEKMDWSSLESSPASRAGRRAAWTGRRRQVNAYQHDPGILYLPGSAGVYGADRWFFALCRLAHYAVLRHPRSPVHLLVPLFACIVAPGPR